MKTNLFYSSKSKFESDEEYKSKYNEDEEELAKLKQQIKKYSSDLLGKMQKKDDNEINFLTDDDENNKKNKKNMYIFIPQSHADFESERIKYPKHSPQILPYISPNKVKSPSQRFRQRWSHLEQRITYQNNYIDSDDNDFTFSNDEDFAIANSNVTPIKKINIDIIHNADKNTLNSNDQINLFYSGSPNSTSSNRYQQQSLSPTIQQKYSNSIDQISSSNVFQTEKFIIQNQKNDFKEENQPNSPFSRIKELKKAFEDDFPQSSSAFNNNITNGKVNSQNSVNQQLFEIEEEEEEINSDTINQIDPPNFSIEDKLRGEDQFKANDSIIKNLQKKDDHINNQYNSLTYSKEEEKLNNSYSELLNNDTNEFMEEEENDFEKHSKNNSPIIDIKEKDKKHNKVQSNDNQQKPNDIINIINDTNNSIQNLKIENKTKKEQEIKNEFGIGSNEEDEEDVKNDFGINLNEEDYEKIQDLLNKKNQKEEEAPNEFSIDFNDEDENEEYQTENQGNISQNKEEESNGEFEVYLNEEEDDENHIETLEQIAQSKEKENNNEFEIESNEEDEENPQKNEVENQSFAYLNEGESKNEFLIDINEKNEENNENKNIRKLSATNQKAIFSIPNYKNANHSNTEIKNQLIDEDDNDKYEVDIDFDYNYKDDDKQPSEKDESKNDFLINFNDDDIGKLAENQSNIEIESKSGGKSNKNESPDKKSKESLSFTTPKLPKGVDSFFESS